MSLTILLSCILKISEVGLIGNFIKLDIQLCSALIRLFFFINPVLGSSLGSSLGPGLSPTLGLGLLGPCLSLV